MEWPNPNPTTSRTKKSIRVFLVDDSPVALVMLKRFLATEPDIEVVGTACDGRQALTAFASAQPDVICTDYLMPNMDGLALIEQTMEVFPRPILVISSTIEPGESHRAFPLLQAGAVDVFPKPTANAPFEKTAAELVQKIRILSGVRVIRRRAVTRTSLRDAPLAREAAVESVGNPALLSEKSKLIRLVAIGASTGGPQVLQTIFGGLPENFPCPILCVQHISVGFLDGLVEWLDSQCRLHIKIASHGETALPGTVYFPKEETHLEIDNQKRLLCSHAPHLGGHRPSITATFESVAHCYGHSAMGVLLTGMGSDGAAGLQAIQRAGGTTLAQDEASCVVFGMPKQAIALGAAQMVLSPAEIVRSLVRLTNASG